MSDKLPDLSVIIEETQGMEYIRRAMRQCGARREYTDLELFRARESVLYANTYWLTLTGVPPRAQSHLAKSGPGWYLWSQTQRPDRHGVDGNYDLIIQCNAEALLNLAEKRLCGQAWAETRAVVAAIREAVRSLHAELADLMQPACVWHGQCRKVNPCGWYQGQKLLGDKE